MPDGLNYGDSILSCFLQNILMYIFMFQMEASDLGELCVSLCFRPISGRLIITVTKIRGLPKATADRTGKWSLTTEIIYLK